MQAESRFGGSFTAGSGGVCVGMVRVRNAMVPLYRKDTCKQDT